MNEIVALLYDFAWWKLTITGLVTGGAAGLGNGLMQPLGRYLYDRYFSRGPVVREMPAWRRL